MQLTCGSVAVQDVAGHVFDENRIRRMIEELTGTRLAAPQGVFHLLTIRDVARDTHQSNRLAVVAAQRNFGGQYPATDAVAIHARLFLLHRRLTRLDDSLFPSEIFLRDFARETVKYRLPDDLLVTFGAEVSDVGGVADD